MRNVTITLDEATALWARTEAARHDTSVSRFVGDVLRERMIETAEYTRASRSYGRRSPAPLSRQSRKYPKRYDLHRR